MCADTTGTIDVKTLFTFLTIFYFPNVFLFLKNVGKVERGKQINKKHFRNNSNEIDVELQALAGI